MATRILFFGALKEPAQGAARLVDLPTDVTNAEQLIDWIAKDDTALKSALDERSVRICVDQEITPRAQSFETPAEIAFLPPFSGG